jgi:hypothetical protein
MAKRKAVKDGPAQRNSGNDGVEPMVIALAEQLGSFLGRVQRKAFRLGRLLQRRRPRSGQADGWLENEALRHQVSQIRDGATQLLDRVTRASTAARISAEKAVPVAKSAARQARGSTAAPKMKISRLAPPKRRKREGESGGTVDAQGKRHRKPPPEEMFDPRLGEPMGKQMGQKSVKNGMRRGRG